MMAWKFLAPGAIAPFTGARWPVPWGPDGGQWLQGRSGEGVHACALGDLPYWLDDELWEVELDAPIFRAARQLVAAAAIDGQVGHDEERGAHGSRTD